MIIVFQFGKCVEGMDSLQQHHHPLLHIRLEITVVSECDVLGKENIGNKAFLVL